MTLGCHHPLVDRWESLPQAARSERSQVYFKRRGGQSATSVTVKPACGSLCSVGAGFASIQLSHRYLILAEYIIFHHTQQRLSVHVVNIAHLDKTTSSPIHIGDCSTLGFVRSSTILPQRPRIMLSGPYALNAGFATVSKE